MLTIDSDAFLDIYPFIERADQLPSARVSFHKSSGLVTFQGDTYTREEVQDLVAAFNVAFKTAEHKYEDSIDD